MNLLGEAMVLFGPEAACDEIEHAEIVGKKFFDFISNGKWKRVWQGSSMVQLCIETRTAWEGKVKGALTSFS